MGRCEWNTKYENDLFKIYFFQAYFFLEESVFALSNLSISVKMEISVCLCFK